MIPIWKGRRRWFFAALASAAMLQALVVAAGAWCVRHMFDRLAGTAVETDHDMAVLTVGLAVAAMTGFVLEVLQRRLGEELALDYISDVRFALFDHHLDSARGGLKQRSQGSLLMPFVGDLTALRSWVGNGLARLCVAAVTLTLLLAIITAYSPRLGAAIGVALGVGAMTLLLLGVLMERSVRELRRRRGALAAFVSDRLASLPAIHLMGRAASERSKVAKRTAALNRAGRRRAWIAGAMRGTAQLSGSLIVLAVLLTGMGTGPAPTVSPGTLVATLSMAGLMAAAINDLGRGLESWYPGRISRARIAAVLQRPARCARRISRKAGPSAGLRLADLDLPPFADPVSATASIGDVVLIEGSTGTGKSCLIEGIAQLTVPESGAVLLEGRDLSDRKPRALRSMVGLASPALPLLRGSLGMNLRYRRPETRADEFEALLAESGLGDVAAGLPHGLETRLHGDGAPLSLGQRQMLSLARAMLGRPRLLLIDSVDTHLPDSTIIWLARQLRSYPGIVLMAVSHPALTACANRHWRIADGRLTEISASVGDSGATVLPMAAPDRQRMRSQK